MYRGIYNQFTGKGIVEKESTTTTKSGDLEIKPAEDTHSQPKKEEKIVTNPTE